MRRPKLKKINAKKETTHKTGFKYSLHRSMAFTNLVKTAK
jgi:hypothetical protein